MRLPRQLDPDPHGTAGGGTATAAPAVPDMAGFSALLVRYGNAESAARQLYDELYRIRNSRRTERKELEALRTRNPQGSIVLIGDDVTRFNAWKALGTPEEVKAKLDASEKTQAELAAAKRTQARAAAAQAHKFSPKVLDDLLTLRGLDVDVRTERKDNADVPVAFVRKAGDANATWEPLPAFAERELKDHLPALRATANGNGQQPQNGPPAGGNDYVSFPDNGAGGTGSATSLVDKVLAERNAAAGKRTNPLMAQGAAGK